MPKTYANVGGTWTPIKKIYANVGGNWVAVKNGYANVGGVWQKIYASGIPITFNGLTNTRYVNSTGQSSGTYTISNNSNADYFSFTSDLTSGQNYDYRSDNIIGLKVVNLNTYPNQNVLHIAGPISVTPTGQGIYNVWISFQMQAFSAQGVLLSNSSNPYFQIATGSIAKDATVTYNIDLSCFMGSFSNTNIAYYNIIIVFDYVLSHSNTTHVNVVIPWSGITWVPEGSPLSYTP